MNIISPGEQMTRQNTFTDIKYWMGILFLFCFNISAHAKAFLKMKNDSIIKHKGYILRQTVLGKDQKSVSYYDYFFLPSDSGSAGIFIKVKDGNVSAESLNALLKKEDDHLWKSDEIQVVALLKEGKWDDPDFRSNVNLTLDPRRQGVYFVLKDINLFERQTSQEYIGIFVKSPQVNKAGKKLKTCDYFFEIDGKEYFVKSGKNTISKDKIESILKGGNSVRQKSDSIKIKGEIKDGLWDTDDPRQQSRVGKYIFIYSIVE